jgi:hypothetical protein
VLTVARQTLRVARNRDDVSLSAGQTSCSVFLIRPQFHPCCSAKHFSILIFLISFLQIYAVTRWGNTPVSSSGCHRFKPRPGENLCTLKFVFISSVPPRKIWSSLSNWAMIALSHILINSLRTVVLWYTEWAKRQLSSVYNYIKIRCKILSSLAVQ